MSFRASAGVFLASLLFCLCSLSAQENFIMVDGHSGKVLVEHGADRRVEALGLVKMTTASVVLDWAKLSETDLATAVLVPNTVGRGENPMGLRAGDQISLRDAMYSMLLGSDDAAATTLATFVGYAIKMRSGGRGNPEDVFVNEMNKLARWVGVRTTKFTGPGGLRGRRRAKTTARDVARMAIYASRHEAFAFFVKQEKRKISYVRAGKEVSFVLNNTNELLGKEGVNGIAAGGPGAVAIHAGKKAMVKKMADGSSQVFPRELVVVVLGSQNRFARASSLLKRGWPLLEAWRQRGMPVQNRAREMLEVPNPK